MSFWERQTGIVGLHRVKLTHIDFSDIIFSTKPSGLFLRGKKERRNMSAILTFLREAKVELARVNWPSQKEVIRYTLLVVVISLSVALFLGALDFLFSFLVETYLLH